MAERFYLDAVLGPGDVVLDGPEAHHLAVVCRLRPGDAVVLFNGDGREYPARVVTAGKKQAVLHVEATLHPARELPCRLVAAAPLPRGDRSQVLLEKLTELGASDFIPLRTRRSVVEPREAKLDKLQRHVIEASKQCGRNRLLRVHPLTAWEDLLRDDRLPRRRVAAHPGGDVLSPQRLLGPAEELLLAVGPEGGLADDEVALARAAGWEVVGLGPRILRVETALIALVVWLGRSLSAPENPP
jgi:16S rRNA (uracil1498-N3)-methyltransferase